MPGRSSVADRVARNRIRREMTRRGFVSYGDGLEIHHLDRNPHNNDDSNLWIADRCHHLMAHGRPCRGARALGPPERPGWVRVCLDGPDAPVFIGALRRLGAEADLEGTRCIRYRLP